MSLNFDYKACKKVDGKNVYDHPNDEKQWHPVAESIVWTLLIVGFNDITEKNIDRVWARFSMYQNIVGPLIRYGDGVKAYITREDLEQHIGVRTNVSNQTDAAWAKHIVKVASSYQVSNKKMPFATARECVAQQCIKYPTKKEEAVTE